MVCNQQEFQRATAENREPEGVGFPAKRCIVRASVACLKLRDSQSGGGIYEVECSAFSGGESIHA